MPFLHSNGITLYYEEAGKGPTVVFVHESAADSRQWSEQTASLSNDYRCIAYNARGYPPSEVPADDAAYGYEWAWRDLETIVEQLSVGAAHIVGLSMGAYAALMLGLNRPELVRSLTLAGCGTGSTLQPDDKMRTAMSALAGLFENSGSLAGAQHIASATNRTGFLKRDPANWQRWYDDLETHDPQGMAYTFRNYQGRRPSLFGFAEQMKGLKIPTLLAVGEEDQACFEVNLFLQNCIPNASLNTIPSCGHAINLEYPDRFNDLLKSFLDEVEISRGK